MLWYNKFSTGDNDDDCPYPEWKVDGECVDYNNFDAYFKEILYMKNIDDEQDHLNKITNVLTDGK